jgi:hypothetical protein
MSDSNQQQFDFNRWSSLASEDPNEFEIQRQKTIDTMIQMAPAAKRSRLRKLQWRIDQQRKLAGSPMAACIKLSNMMWESVMGKNGLLDALEGRYQHNRLEPAQVLRFPICPERSSGPSA